MLCKADRHALCGVALKKSRNMQRGRIQRRNRGGVRNKVERFVMNMFFYY